MTPRQALRAEFEMGGVIWSRAQRRRLARAGSGPGRRRARRWPLRRPIVPIGFTRQGIATLALLATPAFGSDDVAIDSPRPGSVVVTLSGRGASMANVEAVRAVLMQHCPLGVELDVRAAEGRR